MAALPFPSSQPEQVPSIEGHGERRAEILEGIEAGAYHLAALINDQEVTGFEMGAPENYWDYSRLTKQEDIPPAIRHAVGPELTLGETRNGRFESQNLPLRRIFGVKQSTLEVTDINETYMRTGAISLTTDGRVYLHGGVYDSRVGVHSDEAAVNVTAWAEQLIPPDNVRVILFTEE